jgi:biopolymer transport protein ExbD
MRLRQRAPGHGPEENLIPLINIVFLILIFFLVASTLRSFDPSGLDLTSAQADAGADQGPNVLVAFSDGRLALAGEVIAADALEPRLAAFAEAEPDLPLLIAPDRALPAERLVDIANTAKRAGVERVKLIVRKPGSPGPGDP